MNTASRWLLALGLLITAAGMSLYAPRAEAQDVEITGPLAGAPAVRRMRIYRDGRFQIQPMAGFTIQDEFARTLLVGAQAGYHFTDWLGLHAFGMAGALSLDTDLTDRIKDRGQTTDRNQLSLPSAGKFDEQIGRVKAMAGLQATFIPLRGKLSLFQALFVDTDFYIFAGVAGVNVQERADVKPDSAGNYACNGTFPTPPACLASQTDTASRWAIAPTFGVGLSLYITDFMGLTLEYRAFPFKWNTSGTDEAGLNKNRSFDSAGEFPDGQIDEADRLFHFNQMFGLGLAFYLPFHSEVTK